jgi:chemotaxis protein methyltransferase CheR
MSGDVPPLSPEYLRSLCAFVYRRTGISYDESKRYYLERRVADRMALLGLNTVGNYMARLETDRAEAEAIINAITVNETYFYREDHQLRCLGNSLLPEIVARRRPGDLVRIWSVPCSTGEEPYSIAIWLLENWKLVDAYNIEIVGSDIDTQVLAAAARGAYGPRALARLTPDLLDRYFEPPAGETRAIINDLRESVTFTPVNLTDAATLMAQGRFDVIFCRNVLIYFDNESRLTTVDNLFDALLPGGFICLGHTESMSRISQRYVVRRFPDAFVAQRPLDSPPGPPPD